MAVTGLGAHRLDRLEPEHLERFYRKMQANGSAAGTAHHAHRTMRTALGEALRRGHVPTNAAEIAKAPRLEEEEIEPYTIEEIQSLLLQASKRRNSARWVIQLALGLRQGEALGLHWEDIDLETGYLRTRNNRLRSKYAHGCGGDCGRKAGYCPQREQVRREYESTRSRAGRRTIGLPDPLIKLLRRHLEEQERERIAAGDAWQGTGYVFAQPDGSPLVPNTATTTGRSCFSSRGYGTAGCTTLATPRRRSSFCSESPMSSWTRSWAGNRAARPGCARGTCT